MNLLRLLLLLGLAMATVGPAVGHTWYVARDGSGDFSVIQDAVDAASDRDTIEIGRGWYTEYHTVQIGTHHYDFYVEVPEGLSLVFRGAGIGMTFIGPENSDEHERWNYGIGTVGGNSLVVEDISFADYVAVGVYQGDGVVRIDGCRFRHGEPEHNYARGILGHFTGGASVTNCKFIGHDMGFATFYSNGALIELQGCEFENCETGVYAISGGSSNVHIRDSSFLCRVVSVGFLDFAGGSVCDSHAENCFLALSGCGEVSLTGNVLVRDDGEYPLQINNLAPVTIIDNHIESNGDVIKCHAHAPTLIRNNHIIRTGAGYWIMSPSSPNTNNLPVDFTLNHWGTTDLDEIAAGIWDCEDDAQAVNCVSFDPIADPPVAVESHSWSAVKSLFDRRTAAE